MRHASVKKQFAGSANWEQR